MKGVLLTYCPGALLIDICHDLPAFSIHAGAYAIDQASRYFPSATVHVIVVDPGVGTARRAILIETAGQYFIAPDNGVLSLVVARESSARIREINNGALFLKPVSATFHGRDVFAPVAGALASGQIQPDDVGPAIEKIETLSQLEPEQIESRVWRGTVFSVDRFGNVITNFKATSFSAIERQEFTITAGSQQVATFCRTFGAERAGLPFAYFGSSGYIELGINQQNAAAALGVSRGVAVILKIW